MTIKDPISVFTGVEDVDICWRGHESTPYSKVLDLGCAGSHVPAWGGLQVLWSWGSALLPGSSFLVLLDGWCPEDTSAAPTLPWPGVTPGRVLVQFGAVEGSLNTRRGLRKRMGWSAEWVV